ncbi:YitT family protein [Alistipes sp. OttesenSCG-928-L06]|nr:YitT family protein [Alistipes sp. OttesenSCG-928-L06]
MLEKIVTTQKRFSPRWFKSWIYIIVGSFLIAAAFVLFITPYKIVPGGVYGTGIVIHHLFPSIPVGTFGLMLDIPLLLVAFLIFGGKFGTKTIVAAILTPVIMDTMTYFIGEDPATMLGGSINLSGDVLMSCIFGGVFLGTGLALIVRTHATSGGTDIIAMILHKYTKMPFSRCMLIVDSSVVLIGLVVLKDWRIPLYSLITIYVTTKMVDMILDGGSSNKALFILSEKHEQIRKLILEDLDRSGTYIHATGMYTMEEKNMIFVVVDRTELPVVQDYIKGIDEHAFMVVVNAHEIYGEGFKPLVEKQ